VNIAGILRKCNSWQDFRTLLHALTEKQKGDCFETLTKHFLKLNPEYVTLLRNIWNLKEVPPHIREYLNLPQPDEGIDLIAETKDGQYWAIQCKYRDDESTSLSRRQLSTFTGFGGHFPYYLDKRRMFNNIIGSVPQYFPNESFLVHVTYKIGMIFNVDLDQGEQPC
jgi:predicted helicase